MLHPWKTNGYHWNSTLTKQYEHLFQRIRIKLGNLWFLSTKIHLLLDSEHVSYGESNGRSLDLSCDSVWAGQLAHFGSISKVLEETIKYSSSSSGIVGRGFLSTGWNNLGLKWIVSLYCLGFIVAILSFQKWITTEEPLVYKNGFAEPTASTFYVFILTGVVERKTDLLQPLDSILTKLVSKCMHKGSFAAFRFRRK